MQTTKIGVIGCGNISSIYLQNAQRLEILEVVACSDLDPTRAAAQADKYGAGSACTTEDLLADDRVEIVLNLTTPHAHADVALAALEAGKHVYNEKPLTVSREQGRRILDLAREKGLRVGCAPDTFLGAGLQTCRKLIDDGLIGRPVAAVGFMTCHGHEGWHPDPAFYYQTGGGPMFDMGPYYLTALVHLVGPIASVAGATQITFPQRTITSKPKAGTTIDVEVPTHVVGVLGFAQGAVGDIVTSFDVWSAHLPRIEIYGTEGSLSVPDPNNFGGKVRLFKAGGSEWIEKDYTHPHAENSRGLGVADMAYALRSGRPHRAGGELAFHVLDVMHAIHEAAEADRHVTVESTCEQPAPIPVGLPENTLDA